MSIFHFPLGTNRSQAATPASASQAPGAITTGVTLPTEELPQGAGTGALDGVADGPIRAGAGVALASPGMTGTEEFCAVLKDGYAGVKGRLCPMGITTGGGAAGLPDE